MKEKSIAFILAACFGIVILFPALQAKAGLPVPPLPRLVVPAPPPVVLVPGTYVYVAPDVDDDLVFYQGFWYRPYGGGWYRATHYNGPWGFVAIERTPRVLINLPPGYRSVPPGHQRIPYGQLKKNWRTWEHTKHWDKQSGKSHGQKHENRNHVVKENRNHVVKQENRHNQDRNERKNKRQNDDRSDHSRSDESGSDQGGGHGNRGGGHGRGH